MSTVTDIVDYVVDRLEGITKAGGYNTNAGNNVVIGRRLPAETEMPVICVFDTDDEPDEAERYLANMMVTLNLVVEAYLANDGNSYTAVHQIIDDIKAAALVSTDRTLGGLTLDFGYGGREIRWPDDQSNLVAVRFTFVCLYRDTYGTVTGVPAGALLDADGSAITDADGSIITVV